MIPMYSAEVITAHGAKSLSVFAEDILHLDEEIDILTTSAFTRSYSPTPNTMFAALHTAGISVRALAQEPFIDLRSLCSVWLSDEIQGASLPVKRIGCVELRGYGKSETDLLSAIKAYFQMLDLASTAGVKLDTVALPLLGAGSQQISENLLLIPLLTECISFLKRNEAVKKIYFIDKNPNNAFLFAQVMAASYSLVKETATMKKQACPMSAGDAPLAFISYASPDRNVADNLCFKLESKGIRVWYAPRNVVGAYAESIANAIEKATHFIVILSENSLKSEHVLNEIDLAFQKLPHRIKLKPLRIDSTDLTPSFNYYLSRQHWMDAHLPPLEARLDEFVKSLIGDL